jgi:hypothetical protein
MNGQQLNSRSETLAAIALFVLCGLVLIFNELPYEWPPPNWVRSVRTFLSVGTIVLLPVGLCIGWIRSFPRWSYPYGAQVLFSSLYMMNVATPGFLFDGELWGWRALIPLAVVVVISVLIRRSLDPLRKFFTNIREDWTLLTFGLFGSMPLLIGISFDEVDRLYSLYFMVILSFLMVGTVFLYMQRPTHRGRIGVLLIGILLTITLTMAVPTIYWHHHGGTPLLPAVVAGIVVFLVMFSPALIRLFPRPKRVMS